MYQDQYRNDLPESLVGNWTFNDTLNDSTKSSIKNPIIPVGSTFPVK